MADVSDRAELLLDDLPPILRRSTDIQGVVAVLSNEIERFESWIDTVRRNLRPNSTSEYLTLWEALLGLSISPPDKTLAQRQASVIAFYRKLTDTTSGLSWQARLTELIGTGWSYREHDPADGGSPPPWTIDITIPFISPLPSPSGLAVTAGGSGTLSAGTYYYGVSAVNFYGETPIGTVQSVALSGSNRAQLDWTDTTGADSYRVYRGTSSTDLKRLDLGSTLTTSVYNDTGADSLTAMAPTGTNTTGSFQSGEARNLARQITPAHIILTFGYEAGFLLGVSELGDTL